MGLTSCCTCLDLRRGSLAIGIAYAILNGLGAILSIIFLALGPAVLLRPLLLGGVDFQVIITLLFALRILLWVSLIVCLLMVAVSALLIRGVLIDNTCVVLTWLVVQGLVLVLSTIGHIWQLVAAIGVGVALSITMALLMLVWAGVQWYWYAVVAFHYQMMMETETEEKMGIWMNRVQPAAPIETVAGSIEA